MRINRSVPNESTRLDPTGEVAMTGLDIHEKVPTYSNSAETEEDRQYHTGHPIDGAEEGLIALIGAIFSQVPERNHEDVTPCDVNDATD